MKVQRLRCPTCRAPLRGKTPCPRCGTDLAPWMQTLHQAWQLREAARQALFAGEYERACGLALRAWRLHHTEHARKILFLCLMTTRRFQAAKALIRA